MNSDMSRESDPRLRKSCRGSWVPSKLMKQPTRGWGELRKSENRSAFWQFASIGG